MTDDRNLEILKNVFGAIMFSLDHRRKHHIQVKKKLLDIRVLIFPIMDSWKETYIKEHNVTNEQEDINNSITEIMDLVNTHFPYSKYKAIHNLVDLLDAWYGLYYNKTDRVSTS